MNTDIPTEYIPTLLAISDAIAAREVARIAAEEATKLAIREAQA